MISYEFDDEHAELRRTVEEFARDVVAAMDDARDATQIFGGYGSMNELPSPASTATPRSWRSARAPPRCSG